MEFRPCIDIHNGKVKQIVGSSLRDAGNHAVENYVCEQNASYFAKLYHKYNLKGGHIILLNPPTSEYYEATKQQAFDALLRFPGGMQIGGGINAKNAAEFLNAGASHVIVTSYVFQNGEVQYENLRKLVDYVGKENLVLDLSCRKRDGQYYIVTDRWQKFTDVVLDEQTLDFFSDYCDEFLIHAVDVEGKTGGIESELVEMLGAWGKIPTTYAGGVHAMEDLDVIRRLGRGKVNVTIGSALDLFGGKLSFEEIVEKVKKDK